jgi:GT2 family glycosyltransferase
VPADRQKTRRRASASLPADGVKVSGRVEAMAAVSPFWMLAAIADAPFTEDAGLRGRLVAGAGEQRLTVSSLSRASGPDTGPAIYLLSSGVDIHPPAEDSRLILELGDETMALEPADLMPVTVGLQEFAADHLAELAVAPIELLQRIISAIAQKPGAMPVAAPSLALLRECLRTHLPVSEVHSGAVLAAHVDGIWRVDRRSFYVEGWLLDRHENLDVLRLLTPEGRSVEIHDQMFRYHRQDVSELFGLGAPTDLGFIAYVELPEDTAANAGWILQAEGLDGDGVEFHLPAIPDDPVALRQIILDDVGHAALSDSRLLHAHIAPAISRLEQRTSAEITIASVDQHGAPPPAPAVTIVVPLYRRTEFLEQQLAEFVHDAEIRDADLIYMLDSPHDAMHLRPFAQQLFDLYGVPFRLATLSANGGFSVVNNLGASLAKGRMLLLLNSDVLPAAPGWLSRMIEFYDAHPKVGALGPKLLYEDDSIQHAGLYFDRPPGTQSWSNEHYYKGLHREFGPANVARSVPAVTGACLLMGTDLYRSIGGLRGIYIKGDYEDSDLCLRLRAQGLESWYLPDVELYHLEAQSYPDSERQATSYYNQLLHTDIWRDQLAELEEQA